MKPPDEAPPALLPTLDALTLAGVLCARVCHDLAGTVGALSGMLDMLAEAPAPAAETPEAETLDIARGCARDLSDRLRLLRCAWGAESEVDDLTALLPGLPGAARLSVDLSGLAPLTDPATGRLCASLLLVAASALPRGGSITLSGTLSGVPNRLRLTIEGPRAAWPSSLTDPAAATPGPREAATFMALLQAAALGLGTRVNGPCTLEIS